jgi:hypothetical protein
MNDIPRIVVNSRRRSTYGSESGPEQQAAAVWDAAERLGWEVDWVDSVQLDGEPPTC